MHFQNESGCPEYLNNQDQAVSIYNPNKTRVDQNRCMLGIWTIPLPSFSQLDNSSPVFLPPQPIPLPSVCHLGQFPSLDFVTHITHVQCTDRMEIVQVAKGWEVTCQKRKRREVTCLGWGISPSVF